MKNILIVDDLEDNRELLSDLIKAYLPNKFKIHQANDGLQAIKKALIHDYSIILMDIDMPVLRGSKACALIKHCSLSKSMMRIIAITGNNRNDIEEFHNFDDYIAKPVSTSLQLLMKHLKEIAN